MDTTDIVDPVIEARARRLAERRVRLDNLPVPVWFLAVIVTLAVAIGGISVFAEDRVARAAATLTACGVPADEAESVYLEVRRSGALTRVFVVGDRVEAMSFVLDRTGNQIIRHDQNGTVLCTVPLD